MYTDTVTVLVGPGGRTRQVLGVKSAQRLREKFQRLYDLALEKLERFGRPSNVIQERVTARLWDTAMKYSDWLDVVDAYIAEAGGEA